MNYSRDDENFPLTRFESMLKTNDILFFDSSEFENIIHHYLENGKIALAKRAIKLGLEQHPSSVNLRLFEVEILVIENKFAEADEILEMLHELEPNNEEIFIQKANVLSKQDEHQKAIDTLLIAIEISTTPSEDADRTGFVLQNQPVQVEEGRTVDGQEWFLVFWKTGDSESSGWIEANRVDVVGTR